VSPEKKARDGGFHPGGQKGPTPRRGRGGPVERFQDGVTKVEVWEFAIEKKKKKEK